MRSKTPKLLHLVCGRPMIGWVLATALRECERRPRGQEFELGWPSCDYRQERRSRVASAKV
jgi:hypothetical protein